MSFHFYLLAGAYVVAGELVDFLQLIHRGVVLGGQLREGLPFLYGDVRGCFGFLTLAFLVGLAVVVSSLSLAFVLALYAGMDMNSPFLPLTSCRMRGIAAASARLAGSARMWHRWSSC